MAKKGDQDTEMIKSSALAIPDSEKESQNLVEITAYIREDQLLALEILQTAEQHRRGKYFDGSELIQEAIDLLIKKHIIAVKLKQ